MKTIHRLKVGDEVYVKGLRYNSFRAEIKELTCGVAKPAVVPMARIKIIRTGAIADFPQSWLLPVAA